MKTLFFCNTNYQLIAAIQITCSFNKNASVILTNEIKNADELSKRIAEVNIFEKVAVVDVKSKQSSFDIVKKCFFGWIPEKLNAIKFDEFVGFNFDITSHFIFASLYKKNKNLVVNKMEEGLLSYNTPDTSCRILSLAWKLRKFLRKQNLRERAQGFYCFQPKAYSGELKAIAIPKIEATNTVKVLLEKVFAPSGISGYDEKYVFLSCVYDFEGGRPIGELNLANAIADMVGKDNMIVKVHPRDNMERYTQAGFKVDKNSQLPFEVIELCSDFKDKVLITTLSGSLLNFNPVLEQPIRSIYGYKLCDLQNNALAEHYSGVLSGYLDNCDIGLKSIEVAQKLEDIC
ncbi:MAG: hypothetical protein HFE63_01125 [Clostridiales bacterium]|nr:hypothetical protein [Clostridiales bacterium]